MNNHLGKTIRILRQARSLKVTDLAGRSGVSVPYLSLVEKGDRQPSLDVMRRIAVALGVPSEALIVMGVGAESLKSGDQRTAVLADTLGQLIEMESKLSTLLEKEARSEAKGDTARTPRRRNGAKRR